MSSKTRGNAMGGHERRSVLRVFPVLAFAVVVVCLLLSQAISATAFGDAVTASDTEIGKAATTWPDFRGDSTNNAITDAKTPRTKSEAGLIWAVKFNDGYVSPQIIVNDEVIVTSGRGKNGKITKLDKKTGKIIAEAAMKNSSTYSLMPPTYADGKIFVTLSGGSMEAFDAKSLKSLWYYQNKAGGQGNCPIVYSDGLVYTGYWSGETAERSFVCVNAETGKLVWERTCAGGYYWAGALVVGDYLLFGCDDGVSADETGTAYVRCVDKRTGQDVSSVRVRGDQRSTIVYDSDLGRIYFTSKPGYLYSAKFDEGTGRLSDSKSVKIDEETTATPLVYDGRVYVGASSGSFSEGTFSVADAETLKLLYQLDGQSGIAGTVKSAPLLSTAYAGKEASGKLHLYVTINNPPGGITLVTVDPGSTKASQAKATALFTPPKELQQYCIASVICDADGNLYYRNDSNYLMCIGPSGVDPAKYKVPDADDDSGSNSSSGSDSKSDNSKSKSKGSSNSKSGASKNDANSQGSSGARRTGPIQNGSAPANANGSSAGAATVGGGRVSSSSASSASASSSAAASSKSAAAKSKESSAKAETTTTGASAKDEGRHTDSVPATGHLENEPDTGSPDWTVPAIIGVSAIAALAALALVRIALARRRSDGAEESEGLDA